ncbi:hypothetical protein BST97_02150 [Nonlabens spongiae]|uniref:DUF4301 domain-containing protein n=1 Tax=Nonlabens spongiae TaxID=331648 RepID=A0A1W6MH26_9FLAO|nr:DUF4301 family protein [Nonlabens spongiae]ARN76898.1 hypothetical protein BST97_02150 [Nonlabens spongiae]
MPNPQTSKQFSTQLDKVVNNLSDVTEPKKSRPNSSIPLEAEVDELLRDIVHGNHYTNVEEIATLKNGVRKLNRSKRMRFKEIWKKRCKKYSYVPLIPASGSGSRLLEMVMNFAKNVESKDIAHVFIKYHITP